MSLAGAGLSILRRFEFLAGKKEAAILRISAMSCRDTAGFLDRFDSVIFVVPMVYFVTTMYPVVTI